MAFDPETAYYGDYQYRDRVKDVSWEIPGGAIETGFKARFGTLDKPDIQSVAAGLGLSSEAAVVVLWEPKPTDVALADWTPRFAPVAGHILRREGTGQGWIIASITGSTHKGKWHLLVDKEVTNA